MPKVTNLTKKGRLYLVEIENNQKVESFKVSEDLVISYRLISNKEFSNEIYNKLIIEIYRDNYYQKVLNFALYKPRTKAEIIRYLEKMNISEFAYYLNKLAALRLIDDDLYVENYLHESINYKKIGKHKILEDLKMKGINIEIIKEKLEQYSQQQANENCQYWFEKKVTSLNNKSFLQAKKNLLSFLVNKGFNYETAKQVIEENHSAIANEINEDAAIGKEINVLKQKYLRKNLKQSLNTYIISKLIAKGYQYNLIKKYLEGSDTDE